MSEHTTDGLEIDEYPFHLFDQGGIRYDIEGALDEAQIPARDPWLVEALVALGIVFAVVVIGLCFAGACMILHP